MKRNQPQIYDVEIKVELSKEDLQKAIAQFVGYAGATVEFDVSPKGNVRGATVKVRRSEIRHDPSS